MTKIPCAVIGTGNIGTDLMYKLMRSPSLDLKAMIGIDPQSDGVARARRLGIETTDNGVVWLQQHPESVQIVFEATSAKTHLEHAGVLHELGLTAIDLTPAAVGPPVIPTVNLDSHLQAPNVNMVSCGGQAAVPIVAAVSRVTDVLYAEMVSTVASRSAGPGTRQNIDEFTRTTADALAMLGGARRGKAIIVLNPAEPPVVMRNTIYCGLGTGVDRDEVAASISDMVAQVAEYVPGYRLKSEPIFDDEALFVAGGEIASRVISLLEVEGAGDYLPRFAGNLDIMTASAVRVGESIATNLMDARVQT